MSAENAKRKLVKIGTHDGTFHCDDVFACFLLKLLPEFKDAQIVRTRNKEKLELCDVVVDVGAVYDHQTRRYDHHQPSFYQSMSTLIPNKPFNIKLSSAGLVYTHYGHRIIASLLNINEESHEVDELFDKVYETFVQEIDAIDNGVDICKEKPVYQIHTNISNRVKHLLPHWKQTTNDEILFERFEKAMNLVGNEFCNRVQFYFEAWLPAKKVVREAIASRFDVHNSGAIVDLSAVESGVPWKEHLFALEKEMNIENEIKFVIFEDKLSRNWRIMSVPIAPESFQSRVPLHKDWRGLRDEELSAKSGIDQCIFVHVSGFTGGNKTRSGSLQMALKSL